MPEKPDQQLEMFTPDYGAAHSAVDAALEVLRFLLEDMRFVSFASDLEYQIIKAMESTLVVLHEVLRSHTHDSANGTRGTSSNAPEA